MAAPTTDDRTRSPRRAVVAGVLGLVGLALTVLAIAALGDDDRVVLRSAGPAADAPTAPATDPDEGQSPSTTTTMPSTTTTAPPTATAPPTTTAAPSPSTTVAPTTTTAAPAPATAAPAPPPEAPAPTTGTLVLELTPPEEGWSKDVWVSGPDGSTVLPSIPVTGPIVIEGLAPGTYDVFVSQQGPPYGPDENGVEMGGGSQVVRLPADVAAGETTTVSDPGM